MNLEKKILSRRFKDLYNVRTLVEIVKKGSHYVGTLYLRVQRRVPSLSAVSARRKLRPRTRLDTAPRYELIAG